MNTRHTDENTIDTSYSCEPELTTLDSYISEEVGPPQTFQLHNVGLKDSSNFSPNTQPYGNPRGSEPLADKGCTANEVERSKEEERARMIVNENAKENDEDKDEAGRVLDRFQTNLPVNEGKRKILVYSGNYPLQYITRLVRFKYVLTVFGTKTL